MMTDQKNTRPRGLGRGLNALFGDEEADARAAVMAPSSTSVQTSTTPRRTLGTAQLIPNPDQPRRYFKDGALEELAASIREHGIIQPILVRPFKDNEDMYEIIAGERRWRAAQIAQLHEVPVIIREMDDNIMYQIALIENLQREDLTAIEEAQGYKNLIDDYGHTQEDVAKLVGKSRPHIANMIRLLGLPETVQNMVNDGKLSAGHARTLAGMDNAETLAKEIVSKGMSVREAEKFAADTAGRTIRHKHGKNAVVVGRKDSDTIALEKSISDLLGMRVSVNATGNAQGSLMIEYKNLDQLDDLLARLSRAPTSADRI